jgi:hypothetical protein
MKHFLMPVIAAAAVGLAAPAGAAPTGPSVSGTVKSLQDQGFQVIVNKAGNAPLEHCTVSAVRPGQTYQRMESDVPGPRGHMGITTVITAKTVYLDVSC